MPTLDPASFAPLFSLPPSSPEITAFLSTLSPSSSSTTLSLPVLEPIIKSYPDVVYHNYYPLGLSLCFDPQKGLESVDIFNPSPHPIPKRAGRKEEPVYAPPPEIIMTFPNDTLTLPPMKEGESSRELKRPHSLRLAPETMGREFVSCLGEPSRKGSGGWTGLWIEWSAVGLISTHTSSMASSNDDNQGDTEAKEAEVRKVGIMLQLRDPGAKEVITEEGKKKGMGGVWERAARWTWESLKIIKVE